MAKKQDNRQTREGAMTDLQQHVLDEQKLVNERDEAPSEAGGMARAPVDRHEPPVRPELGKETPRDELEPSSARPPRQSDIESQGS